MAEGFDQRQSVLLMYAWTALLCVGSVVIDAGEHVAAHRRLLRPARRVHGLRAATCTSSEPVLLHHYDPRTGEDELVTPADDAFEEEAEKLHERRRHTERRQ